MGAAAVVEAAVDEPLVVPNFSCRRRTSRGGLATEFTNAIFTCRPAETDPQLINPKHHTVVTSDPNFSQSKFLRPFGLLACAEEMFWVRSLRRSSRSSCSLRYISLQDSYSWGDSCLKSRWQWRFHSSSESCVNHCGRSHQQRTSSACPDSRLTSLSDVSTEGEGCTKTEINLCPHATHDAGQVLTGLQRQMSAVTWLLCSMRYSCSGVHRSSTGSRISNGTPPTSAMARKAQVRQTGTSVQSCSHYPPQIRTYWLSASDMWPARLPVSFLSLCSTMSVNTVDSVVPPAGSIWV